MVKFNTLRYFSCALEKPWESAHKAPESDSCLHWQNYNSWGRDLDRFCKPTVYMQHVQFNQSMSLCPDPKPGGWNPMAMLQSPLWRWQEGWLKWQRSRHGQCNNYMLCMYRGWCQIQHILYLKSLVLIQILLLKHLGNFSRCLKFQNNSRITLPRLIMKQIRN
jgi:hypothetical protein